MLIKGCIIAVSVQVKFDQSKAVLDRRIKFVDKKSELKNSIGGPL
jgi:hypothetical protein